MKRTQLKPLALAIAGYLYVSASLQVALADDTEIYVPKEVPADQQIRPNILLILDTSGSMTSTVSGTNKQRIQVLREVVHNLVHDLKDKNVNLGFMRFHGNHGGAVTKAVEQLTPSNAQTFLDKIDATIKASGNTPMSETYYESYLYLAGKSPYWGKYSSPNQNGTDLNALTTGATRNNTNAWKYKSPITHSCQKTHIVYITDGAPTQDVGSNAAIRNLLEKTAPQGGPTNPVWKKSTCGSGNGQCLPHLAEYMYNQDIAAENGYPKKFSDPTNRKQNVTSHFVGFALDLPLLVNAAEAGGGHYFTSNTASGLADALQSIVVDITADNTTFVAPSVAVTAYNNFGFRDELYYALFRPSEGTNWLGNVKKYKLKTRDADGKPITPMIVDRNGTQAIDPETGFFKETASSFWNTVVDGEDVGKGGFAARLTSNNRKIYTWFGNDIKAGSAEAAEAPKSLKVFSTNGSSTHTNSATYISNDMLGVSNNTQRKEVVNWIMGKKTDGTGNRMAIGDILHNEPRLIAYTTDENIERAEGPDSKEEVIIFVGTNEGFIHAIDAKTGNEKFAFLPKELLHVPNKYLTNSKGYNNKAYGMDGYFTALTKYGSRNTETDTRTIETANLYAGMRRGGSNYYALDVKDLDSPKLKWVLKGAYKDNYRDLIYQDATTENYDNIYRPTSGATDITPGFERLGLTYSAAKVGKLKVGGTEKDVLVFTGGYDVKHDAVGNNLPKNDEVGNSIYIVDAETGKLLWRASGSNGRPQTDTDGLKQMTLASMTNSMPASPTLIDINNDGLIDIIYATDLRGQIFRFDIKDGSVDDIKGHLFAKLGGDDKANNRRFFNSPDVALIRDRGQAPYFTISVGSGFRENPLNEETDDRFYMIRDTYVTQSRSALSSPPVITENDLTDVSGLDDDASNAQTVYNNVADFQNQIDLLEAAVRAAEDNFEAHKNDIGYTAFREQYMAKMAEAADKMRDADGKIMGFYPPFDADNYDPHALYNPSYYEQHDQEVTDQYGLQQVKMELLHAIQDMDPADPNRQALANLYAGLESMQNSLDEAAKVLVEKENFILKGHAYPELTEGLKSEIDSRFPGVITDYSSYGDFSDLANLLDTALESQYTAHFTNGAKRAEINGKLADLKLALGAGPSSYEMDYIKALLPGVTPGTADVNDILAGIDQEQAWLEDLEIRSNKHNKLVADVEDLLSERNGLLSEAADFKSEADAREGTFQHYLDLIDAAYADTRHPETGIYALRVKINDEYKKLDLAGDTMSEEQKAHLRNSSGFMLRLPRGEKVLADSISYSGTVLFSTFSPRGEAVSECGSDVGVGRTYGLSLRTAEGVFMTEIGGETKAMRSMVNKQAGIPPSPTVMLFPSPTCEGENCPQTPPPCENGLCIEEYYDPITPTYWREAEQENL